MKIKDIKTFTVQDIYQDDGQPYIEFTVNDVKMGMWTGYPTASIAEQLMCPDDVKLEDLRKKEKDLIVALVNLALECDEDAYADYTELHGKPDLG